MALSVTAIKAGSPSPARRPAVYSKMCCMHTSSLLLCMAQDMRQANIMLADKLVKSQDCAKEGGEKLSELRQQLKEERAARAAADSTVRGLSSKVQSWNQR